MSSYELRSLLPRLDADAEPIRNATRRPPWSNFQEDDAKALVLAQWFKSSFMRWVDPITCPVCGGETRSVRAEPPRADETWGGASRVEVHQCIQSGCGGVRRFPRHNSVRVLSQTREGRCGEWISFEARSYGLPTHSHQASGRISSWRFSEHPGSRQDTCGTGEHQSVKVIRVAALGIPLPGLCLIILECPS